MDERHLLEAIAAGDKAAFVQLYRLLVPRVTGFLRQTLPGPTADEVAQEVFVRVWRQAALYDPVRGAVTTWIFSIARHARIDALRRSARPQPDPTDPMWVPPAPQDPDRALSEQRAQTEVHAAVAALPRAQVDVIERAYVRGQSLAEIAAETGLPLGTVKSRARLALAALRVALPAPDARE